MIRFVSGFIIILALLASTLQTQQRDAVIVIQDTEPTTDLALGTVWQHSDGTQRILSSLNPSVWITVTGGGGGGGAPTNATYITQTPNASLSAEQALNALSDGILKHASGIISLAIAGTDYVATNDSRLTDARTPTAHASTHVTGGNDIIPNAIAGGNAGLFSGTDKSKLDGIASGAEVNVNADWNSVSGDSQILNKPTSFTPSAHASTHISGGSDSIKLDDLAVPDDNTDLNASTLRHGLLQKLPGGTTTFLRADGTFAAPPGGGSGPTYVSLAGDVINATQTYANITGLSWTVDASTNYDIECIFRYDANATTTGIGIGWTGPASPTLTQGGMISGLTGATSGFTTSVGNDTGATTTASVATTNNTAIFKGIWRNGINAGTLQMRFKSEVAIANAITLKTGSMCKYAAF